MTSNLLWSLIAVQMAMGFFDTAYHHELTERLAWRVSQVKELRLHGARNLLYALLFLTLGWCEARGIFAGIVIAVLAIELVITLIDFVEEDMTRKLPASERITHTLLALNYGAILVLLLPVLGGWAARETAIVSAWHGIWSILTALAALGVTVSGLRDFAAARRLAHRHTAPAAGLLNMLAGRRTILVTGATGFIGTRLVEALNAAGQHVIVLARNPAKAAALRPPYALVTSLDQIANDTRIDAIVNLAGEPISNGLWTKAKRHSIVQSRVDMTAGVVSLIARLEHRPQVLVSASGIGWYGIRGDEALRETDDGTPCFSRDICLAWEGEAAKAENYGVRTVRLRIGLVMGTDGGMLSRLLMPFEFGLGGPMGNGAHWMSWIARDDLVRLIGHAIATPALNGPVNATAPTPLTNKAFARELGHALRRPAFLPLPGWPLKRLAGDFATELLLGGQRVLPEKALASGFRFRHETLASALGAILGREAQPRASVLKAA